MSTEQDALDLTRLNSLALRRLHSWIAAPRPHHPIQVQALAFELGQLGFALRNREAFSSITRAEFEEGVATLQAMRGGDVEYVPLFVRFPDDLPNDGEYLLRRILGFLGLPTFLDSSRFGADPMTQMQRQDLWQAAATAQRQRLADIYTEWMPIAVISPEEAEQQLAAWALDLVYGATPIREVLWDDLFTAIDALQLDVASERIQIKETLARLAARDWQRANRIAVKTPTDLLRMFAALQGEDVSLAKPVALKGLKLSKHQRRTIAAFLNQCSALEEDLLRYRGLWLSLSRWLHPGDFAKPFPRVARAFDDLRNRRLQSFEAQIIQAPGSDRLERLLARPALLLRKLTWLLKECSPDVVAAAVQRLHERADELPLPLLATAYCAVRYEGARVAIVKHGKPHALPARAPLGDVAPVLGALESLILAQLRGSKDWRQVWIDPALDKLVLPFQARQQSEGLLNLGRGSRWAIASEVEVLRLFVYWQERSQRTDLDLSVLLLDAAFQVAGHVAWNNYSDNPEITHSGDLQSAPLGAAEFIDLRLSAFRAGYLLPSAIRYTGERFSELSACYAGWMYRQQVGAETQAFDPKTVAQKVDVHQDGRVWLPFLFDGAARELVYLDLYLAGRNTVEDNPHFPVLAAAFARYWQARPTFGLLARWYVQANCASLVARADAETTIGCSDDCTINVLQLVGQGVTSF